MIYVDTYIYIYIYTYIHTYIHTYVWLAGWCRLALWARAGHPAQRHH